MNDRFKFRVFLKYNQIMCDIDSYCFLQGLNKCVFHFTNGGQKTLKNDDFILIQCTGLKDKNDKLIYEGDIVKYKDEVYDLCIGRIQWDNAHYELQYYTGEKYGWFSHILCLKHIKNVEVIGNIYENKELLKCQK